MIDVELFDELVIDELIDSDTLLIALDTALLTDKADDKPADILADEEDEADFIPDEIAELEADLDIEADD